MGLLDVLVLSLESFVTQIGYDLNDVKMLDRTDDNDDASDGEKEDARKNEEKINAVDEALINEAQPLIASQAEYIGALEMENSHNQSRIQNLEKMSVDMVERHEKEVEQMQSRLDQIAK